MATVPRSRTSFDARLQSQQLATRDVGFGGSMGAVFEQDYTTDLIRRKARIRKASEIGDAIDAETLNEQNKDLGLTFDRPRTQAEVGELRSGVIKQRTLDTVTSMGPTGPAALPAQLAAGIAGSIADPIDLASMFVPIVGPGSRARLLATVGRGGARVAEGAIEGAVGTALMEPAYYGLSQEQKLDYTLNDSLFTVGIGALFGAGVGGARHLYARGGEKRTQQRLAEIQKQGAEAKAWADAIARGEMTPDDARLQSMPDAQRRRIAAQIGIAEAAEGKPITLGGLARPEEVDIRAIEEIGNQRPRLIEEAKASGATPEQARMEAEALIQAQYAIMQAYPTADLKWIRERLPQALTIRSYSERQFIARATKAGSPVDVDVEGRATDLRQVYSEGGEEALTKAIESLDADAVKRAFRALTGDLAEAEGDLRYERPADAPEFREKPDDAKAEAGTLETRIRQSGWKGALTDLEGSRMSGDDRARTVSQLTGRPMRGLRTTAARRSAVRKWVSAQRRAEPDAAKVTETPEAANARTEARSVELVRDAEGRLLAPNGKPSKLPEHLWRVTRTPTFKRWFGDWQADPENASKALDENGEPKVFLHTSPYSFDEFDLKYAGSQENTGTDDWVGKGFYFADKSYEDDPYGEVMRTARVEGRKTQGAAEIPVFLNLRSPYISKSELDKTLFTFELTGVPVPDELRAVRNSEDYTAFFRKHIVHSSEEPKTEAGRAHRKSRRLWREMTADENRARFLALGYDGVIDSNQVGGKPLLYQAIAMHPEQIKSTFNLGAFDPQNPDIRFQRDQAQPVSPIPGFSMATQRALERIDMKTGNAQAWRNRFERAGVSKAELNWLGWDAFSSRFGDQEKIPRKAVDEWIAANTTPMDVKVLKKRDTFADRVKRGFGKQPEDTLPGWGRSGDGLSGYREILFRDPKLEGVWEASEHYEGQGPVVLHVRAGEADVPGYGRTYVAREIQSDLHQNLSQVDAAGNPETKAAWAKYRKGALAGNHWKEFGVKYAIQQAVRDGADAVAFPADNGLQLYRKEIPAFLRRYLKPWGAKAEKVDIDIGGNANAVNIIRITPEMRESLKAGEQLLFQSEPSVARQREALADAARSGNSQTETPAFKRWFGDSKVVDRQGGPLVVYHGTRADFDEFSPDALGSNTSSAAAKAGFFFTSDPALASDYAGSGSVMPTYLSLKNPKVIDDGLTRFDVMSGKRSANERTDFAAAAAEARAAGHDGLVVRNTFDGGYGDIHVVFEPTQIKSATGNRGTFDPTNPDIRFQEPEGPRGFFSDQTGEIGIFSARNESTVIHETGHYVARVLGMLADQPDAPAQIRQDVATMLDWASQQTGVRVTRWADMDVEHHEAFARGFEAYYREGKAPNSSLERVFAFFRDVMTRLYRQAEQLGITMTPEARAVFERYAAPVTDAQKIIADATFDPVKADADQARAVRAEIDKLGEGNPLDAYEAADRADPSYARKALRGVIADDGTQPAYGPSAEVSTRIGQLQEERARLEATVTDDAPKEIRDAMAAAAEMGPYAEKASAVVTDARQVLEEGGSLAEVADMARREGLEAEDVGKIVRAFQGLAPEGEGLRFQSDTTSPGFQGYSGGRQPFTRQRPRHATIADAAQALIDEQLEAAEVQQRNAAYNAVISQRLMAQMREAQERYGDAVRGMEGALSGVNSLLKSGRLSADALGNQWSHVLTHGLIREIDETGLLRWASRQENSRAIARELEDIQSGGGTQRANRMPDANNSEARIVAQIIHDYQQAHMKTANRFGAWIRPIKGYITKQTHDSAKMRRASFETWAEFTSPLVDWERVDVSPGGERAFLQAFYDNVVTGEHARGTSDDLADAFKPSGRNLAKSMSEHRVIHFKGADNWVAYNERFGASGLMESVFSEMDHGGRQIGLMQTFGTNPEAMVDMTTAAMRQELRDNGGPQSAIENLKGGHLKNRLMELDGRANAVAAGSASEIWATASSTLRFLQSTAKLGSAVLSAPSDIAMTSMTLARQGMNPIRAILGGFQALVEGVATRNGMQTRELAEVLGVGVDGMLSEMSNRFETAGDYGRGQRRAMNFFFKATGLTQWTNAVKRGFGLMFARELGMNARKNWNALRPMFRSLLEQYGFTERDWQMIGERGLSTIGGREYIDPRQLHMAAREASSADAAMLTDLAVKISTMIQEQADFASPTPGAGERARLRRGTQRGTIAGEAFRLVTQFKAFPVTVMTRPMGQLAYGRGARTLAGGIFDPTNMMHLATYLSMGAGLGGLSLLMKDMAKGREPREIDEKFALAAIVQSGGLGIYGDFLFAQRNRFGNSALETAAGPGIGAVADMIGLVQASVHGGFVDDKEAPGYGELIQLVKGNTPFANVFYAKAMLDYLFVFQAQEMANPGYLSRMERRMKRRSNQRYMFSPSAAIPRGGGDRLLEGIRE